MVLLETTIDPFAALHRVADDFVHVTQKTHELLNEVLEFGHPVNRSFHNLCYSILEGQCLVTFHDLDAEETDNRL